VEKTKCKLNIALVLFPGPSHHLLQDTDAVIFLSLISGRNPDFLIGQYVKGVDEFETLKFEVIPTFYLLINGGQMTSVEYISRTTPIPKNTFSIAKKTAIAGKYLGHQLIYANAGRSALNPINCEMIQFSATVDSPLIIGGGPRSISAIEMAHKNGANLVVIGNRLEEGLDFLLDLKLYKEVQK